jgi:SpoVK/Ycf46/Vps4 family AAA+-type ATPase
MTQSTSRALLKEISDLAASNDAEQLICAAELLGKTISLTETPLPPEAKKPLISLIKQLHKLAPSALEQFTEEVTKCCLLSLNDTEMQRSIADATKRFCRLRGAKNDYDAVLSLRLTLLELLFDKNMQASSNCAEYFVTLSENFIQTSDVDDLDTFWKEAIDFSSRVYGPFHRNTADAFDLLGRWMRIKCDYQGACEELQKAIEIFAKSPEQVDTLLENLLNLAETAVDGHLNDTVFSALERARPIINQLNLKDSSQSARLLNILGIQYFHEDKHEYSIYNFKQALAIYRKLDAFALSQHRILLWLAIIYSQRDEPDLVNNCYVEALSLEPEIPLDHADEIGDNFYSIASFYSSRHDPTRAAVLLERALQLKMLAPKHLHTAVEVLEKELARVRKSIDQVTKSTNRPLSNVLGEIEHMVGLEDVKMALKEHGVYMDFLRLRRKRGFDADEKPVLHAVFTGNPGTGKTTVAKLLGQIYHRLGLLSVGHVHVVVRADLVGASYGSGEELTRKALNAAKGGVLFVDEAYGLVRRFQLGAVDERDPGQQVIETLLPALTDPEGDIAIVLAGYPKEMEDLLNSNPGFRSRFKLNISFNDYTPPQLLQIAINKAGRDSFSLSEGAKAVLSENLEKAYQSRNKSFGNARYVHSLIDDCKRALGLRCMARTDASKLSDQELSQITGTDVRTVIGARQSLVYHAPVNEKELAQALEELNSLIGLSNVKEFVNELVKVVRVYRQLGKDVLSEFKLHLVFADNPGTGKTTVARIYSALGILDKGHLVECDRSTMIGQYIGHSEVLTKQKIEEALGGVLFIDEAYALMGGENDFGVRVIEVLLKEMEDRRAQFFIIFAGYPAEMDLLMDSNPGLRSRVDRFVRFEDFSIEELKEIALDLIKRRELSLSPQAVTVLAKKLHLMKASKGFANGRSVRTFIERTVLKHFAALAEISTEHRTPHMLTTIEAQILEQIDAADSIGPAKRLGF